MDLKHQRPSYNAILRNGEMIIPHGLIILKRTIKSM